MKISDIKITERVRKDIGDITELAESIDRLGLFHPIVVTPDGELIIGARRIEAFKHLGHDSIPERVMSITEYEEKQQAEVEENTQRKDLPPSRMVAYWETLDKLKGGRGKTRSESEQVSQRIKRAAKATGTGVGRLSMAKAVVDYGDEEIIAEMDKSGNVNEAYKKVKNIKKKKKLKEMQSQIAAQVRNSPAPPKVSISHYKDWIPLQPQVDMILTDPPYMTDNDNILEFAQQWLPMALNKLKPTGRAYIFIGSYPEELQAYLSVAMPDQILVWTYRNTLGPSPKDRYKMNWQAILYYQGPEAGPLDCPIMLEQFMVQDISAPDGRQYNRYHAWQKPDELAERFIRHATQPGDIVMDPFCGTGTFSLTAQRLGRVGIGCDVSEENLKIAEERGCIITGKKI